MGERAAKEDAETIAAALSGSDIVFITAGLGGGTGSGAAPVIAAIAKAQGALTIAVVTKPFSFEGNRRAQVADAAMIELGQSVDTLIAIPNDRVRDVVPEAESLVDAFKVVDGVLRQGVQGILEIITIPGLINLDFADLRAVMKDAGPALMGVGHGQGREPRRGRGATGHRQRAGRGDHRWRPRDPVRRVRVEEPASRRGDASRRDDPRVGRPGRQRDLRGDARPQAQGSGADHGRGDGLRPGTGAPTADAGPDGDAARGGRRSDRPARGRDRPSEVTMPEEAARTRRQTRSVAPDPAETADVAEDLDVPSFLRRN